MNFTCSSDSSIFIRANVLNWNRQIKRFILGDSVAGQTCFSDTAVTQRETVQGTTQNSLNYGKFVFVLGYIHKFSAQLLDEFESSNDNILNERTDTDIIINDLVQNFTEEIPFQQDKALTG